MYLFQYSVNCRKLFRHLKTCFSKVLFIVLLFCFHFVNAQVFWERTNGPNSGNDLQIWTTDMRDDGLLFAAGNNYGLFKSTDNGDYWIGIEWSGVRKIAFKQPGMIYAAAYEGVFKSTDDGVSWTKVLDISPISIEVNLQGDIFAGTVSHGIYRSTDDGINWTAVNNGINYSTLGINTIFANYNGDMFAGTNNGVFRSTNNGNYWLHSEDVYGSVEDIKVTVLGYLLAGSGFAGSSGRLFISTDDGAAWFVKWSNDIGITCLEVDLNSDDIYAGTGYDGIYLSTDLGDTWMKISGAVPNNLVSALALDSDGVLFDATWGDGMFRSTNSGGSWEQINVGFVYPRLYNMTLNSKDHIFVGTDEGVFRSEDSGNSWISVNNGIEDEAIYSLAINQNDFIFAGLPAYGVAVSQDGGENWSVCGPEFQTGLAIAFTSNYIFLGTYDGGVYRASIGSYYYWSEVNNGLNSSYVRCLAVNRDQDLFAGTQAGIFRSSDNGDNWEAMNDGLGFLNIGCISVNLRQDLFAGTRGGGIYRSEDNGKHWKEVNNGFNAALVSSVVCDSVGQLFAAAEDGGVFESHDNGDSWFEIDEGLEDSAIYALAVDSLQYLFAASLNRGVWRSVNPVVTEIEDEIRHSNTIALYQNYPNPFNPATMISYQLPFRSFVTLRVYNILGEQAAILVNEEKAAGRYDVEFDGSGLSTGVYIYQLRAGSFVQSGKMVLVR